MRPTNFSIHLSNFLSHYLAHQRNLSPNTIRAYRDVFVLLLRYCRDEKKISIDKLTLENIDVALVEEYIDYLEKSRHCSARTLNQRLAVFHAFFRYIQIEDPELILQCQRIISIPLRRFTIKEVSYLSKEYLSDLLAKPDLKNLDGRRDAVLLSVLYDTGARVQEIVDLSVGDIRLESPAQARILGKGRKIRIVPIMDNTVALLTKYLGENDMLRPEKWDYPLFTNRMGQKLTRFGVSYILQKYVKMLKEDCPYIKQKISPHTLRHTKAMHLLQGGVSLDIIRDFMGHVDIKTTEIYARANLEAKRAAIEKVSPTPIPNVPSWKKDKSLLQWLQNL